GGGGGARSGVDAGARSSCSPAGVATDQSSTARTPLAAIPGATLAAAVAANNAFTVDLYQNVVSDPEVAPINVVTSPFTANIALTMTYAGAAGETATQMASAL